MISVSVLLKTQMLTVIQKIITTLPSNNDAKYLKYKVNLLMITCHTTLQY